MMVVQSLDRINEGNRCMSVAFIYLFCYVFDISCQHGTVSLFKTDETISLPLFICTIRGIYKGDAG
jgi:hypothetical protein